MALALPVYAKSVSVRGYYRKDGTYVRPHMRSSPDGNFWNNWSTKGNVNPYTGEMGTKTSPYGSSGSYSQFGGINPYTPYAPANGYNQFGLSAPYTIKSPATIPFSSSGSSFSSGSPSAMGSAASAGTGSFPGVRSYAASSMAAQTSLPNEIEPTASSFLRAGDYENAVIWYSEAVRKNNTEEVREKLALSYLGLATTADPATAVRLLHTSMAIKFSPQAEEHLNNVLQGMGYDPYDGLERARIAEVSKQQNDHVGELVELQQAVFLNKGNGPALLHLSEAYDRYGLAQEALRTYKMAADAGVDPGRISAGIKNCEAKKNSSVQFPDHFFVNLRNAW